MAAATEMLIATPAVRNIIRQGKVQELHTYLEAGIRNGMHTMARSVQALIGRGMIDADTLKHLALD
jgi:twitching motility protein PilT